MSSTANQAYDHPVPYVDTFGSRPCAVNVSWYSLMNGSLALAGSSTSLPLMMMYVPLPVSPWSISGLKNWLSEAHVADMITSGCQSACFSTAAIAWVQNAPVVSISSTSAFVAARVVNWLSRFAAAASWVACSTTLMSEPSVA